MVRKKEEVSTPLLDNILSQASAFQTVVDYQLGPGRDAIERSAGLLRASKHIVLTGMGASLFACTPLRYMLAARGFNASVIEAAELLHFLEPTLNRDTVVVLVSRSGESVEVTKLLDRLKLRNCPTIGVVNVPGSDLAVRADECILLNSPADQLVAVQTYLATLVTLALLGAACLNELETARLPATAAIAQLGLWVPECVAASSNWQSFVDPLAPLYILGRGPGMASVDEGVLLMHEVAKSTACGLSVAQFRHGFVESTDENLRAVIIGTERKTLDIDHQFALDATRMGGSIRWIGPLPSGSPIQPLCEWPKDVPALFAPVFTAVPLQMLAYRTAEARGIVPGVFRWASTVTGSESGFPGLSES
jgi:glucosamine--fructose-6-phosphate aminotransferase (isomerizing)